MRISDWSSDVCSSDLHRGKLRSVSADQAAGRRDDAQCPGDEPGALLAGPAGTIALAARFRLKFPDQSGRDAYPRRCGHHRLAGAARSEEHTSEPQSLMRISYADFCLKKKNNLK